MLTIRLSQTGKKNKKMFRLIISENARDTFGDALEILGSYNPHSKDLQVKGDRVQYWISKGAQMSPTVNNLLIDKKVIEGKKEKASKLGEPNKKKVAQQQAKDEAAKKKADEEAAAKAAAEAPVEAPTETPVETTEAPAETVEAATEEKAE